MHRGIFSISCADKTTENFQSQPALTSYYDSVCAGYEYANETISSGAYISGSKIYMPHGTGNIRVADYSTTTGTVYSCPLGYPIHFDDDNDGKISAGDTCGEPFDFCKDVSNQSLGVINDSSFCYSTETPQGQAVNCNMILINNGIYQPTGETCDCFRDEITEYGTQKCFNDYDLGNNIDEDPEIEPTQDESPDPDPIQDENGDALTPDELEQVENQLLLEIENNTDELEQINKKSNEFLKGILKKLGISNATLDALLKKEIPSTGGGTGNGDGEGDGDGDGEDEDQCPSGQYLFGEDCISFPSSSVPEQNDMDLSEVNTMIDDSETELEQLYDTIKADLDNLFQFNLSGGNCEQNQKTFNVGGSTVTADFSLCSHQSDFNVIGMVIIFLASIGAFFILIGGRNE